MRIREHEDFLQANDVPVDTIEKYIIIINEFVYFLKTINRSPRMFVNAVWDTPVTI